MKNITFIGAGSSGFTRGLIKDILTFSELSDCCFTLMDINQERLDTMELAAKKLIKAGDYPATVTTTTNRAKALEGADAVVITILVGDLDVLGRDIAIPMKYGVDICAGGTRGPAGIFRAMRTLPTMLDIAADIERVCPNAVVLNYTNPMAMICKALQAYTPINVVGLCHSVQGTAHMLAKWIGAPIDEITYVCAGINHQAWYLEYKWNGDDATPLIRNAIKNPDIYNKEQVRNEMFLHLDYYVTETSGHNSEYNPWFRKRPDLIEKYCTHGTNWNPGVHSFVHNDRTSSRQSWRSEMDEWLSKDIVHLGRGKEYASAIINAMHGDGTPFEFNGNVLNSGIIPNLPENCCVDVPVVAESGSFRKVDIGPLPPHLAALNSVNASCENMAVDASRDGDKRKIFHAICMDPLTSAVCSLEEIRSMVDEMFAANKEWLPQFSV